MASPHVAGTVALMWSAAPSFIGDIAATRAFSTNGFDTSDLTCGGTAANNNVWGEGRLDAFAAVGAAPRGPTGTLHRHCHRFEQQPRSGRHNPSQRPHEPNDADRTRLATTSFFCRGILRRDGERIRLFARRQRTASSSMRGKRSPCPSRWRRRLPRDLRPRHRQLPASNRGRHRHRAGGAGDDRRQRLLHVLPVSRRGPIPSRPRPAGAAIPDTKASPSTPIRPWTSC